MKVISKKSEHTALLLLYFNQEVSFFQIIMTERIARFARGQAQMYMWVGGGQGLCMICGGV